ncbi:AraC family transcriptional regulator ligand-binding domain-containing protein (plasmid) [Rhizobium sp. 32-5/1]|uniref:AraC family transcriptional regulator ligand-binding domain-containing protein n=1 Tax=Rhizobium sp. 32-5/1 TaxID=3019602 RepID=UPI00240E2603|nr:AraC family transcriptional regulator ligand-binding domain-containing protein [Rhizobium sp. 32-5/1]WEZ85344.1 AraC family transcriptional regulator ligand-binding domain-containing protein [Rhizobium sp. 32-5/1]
MVPLALYVSLFEDAARLSGLGNLGAVLGTKVTPGDLGPAGVLFSISPTIREAVDRLTLYVTAIQGGTSSGFQEIGDNYVWNYQISVPNLWPRRQDSEFTLSICCQLIRLCFSRNWQPAEIHFEHPEPPNRTNELDKIFKTSVKFGQSSNRLVITKADAQRIFRSEDPALVSILERHINDLSIKESKSLRDRVNSLIGMHLGYRRITIALIAEDLGVTQRTLQRRLQHEGTSLRELVECHRRELAQKQIDASLKKFASRTRSAMPIQPYFGELGDAGRTRRIGANKLALKRVGSIFRKPPGRAVLRG